MLTVTVRFVGVLQQVFKKKQVKLKLAHSPTVKELIEKLAENSPEARRSVLETESNQIHPALLVLVNGKEIGALDEADTRIRDADELVLISVSHGG
jgi:molybdopterin converting factor small subunit